jgi:mRNA interferase MazF
MEAVKRWPPSLRRGTLDPTQGSEIHKTRPCLVVSPDETNAHIAAVIVAPLTTAIRAYHSRVRVHIRGKIGEAALDQIRAIEKTRLVKKLGEVPETTADGIAAVLVEMLRRP